MGECLYKIFICFNELLCIYLGEGRGGGALMHVYVLERKVSFSYRTNRWIFTKRGRDEVLMVPCKCCSFSARSVQGRIQDGAKIGHTGFPSSTNFSFRPEATNRMHSNDLAACGMKCYFWFNSEVQFLTRF